MLNGQIQEFSRWNLIGTQSVHNLWIFSYGYLQMLLYPFHNPNSEHLFKYHHYYYYNHNASMSNCELKKLPPHSSTS